MCFFFFFIRLIELVCRGVFLGIWGFLGILVTPWTVNHVGSSAESRRDTSRVLRGRAWACAWSQQFRSWRRFFVENISCYLHKLPRRPTRCASTMFVRVVAKDVSLSTLLPSARRVVPGGISRYPFLNLLEIIERMVSSCNMGLVYIKIGN